MQSQFSCSHRQQQWATGRRWSRVIGGGSTQGRRRITTPTVEGGETHKDLVQRSRVLISLATSALAKSLSLTAWEDSGQTFSKLTEIC